MPTLYDYEVIKKEKELLEYNLNEKQNELDKTKNKLESLLKELLDRKVLSSWQYNGVYSYEYSKNYSSICDYQDEAKRLEKELEQWKQEWQDTQIKANEEGFARTTLQIKYAELQKENAKLREYAKFLQGAYCGIDRELVELKKENTELLESCRDKDRQLNKWFISYNEVIKENEELKKQMGK